jgi:hypothetical protein
MSNDLSIATTYNVPQAGAQPTKPPHLVVLNGKVGVAKNSHNECFLAIEAPEMQTAYVKARGYFMDATPEDISKGWRDMLTSIDKDRIEELYIPWSDVKRVKNLTYKAK